MPLKPKVCSKILEGLGWQMRVVDISADHGYYVQAGVHAHMHFTEHQYMQFELYERLMTAWVKSLSRAEWQQTLSED